MEKITKWKTEELVKIPEYYQGDNVNDDKMAS
jgi:hypothetical protein